MISELRRSIRTTTIRLIRMATPPEKYIFYEYIFIKANLLPHKPLLSNQFQYPRQDQMTLNILLLIINY